jgi:hypothetical protein
MPRFLIANFTLRRGSLEVQQTFGGPLVLTSKAPLRGISQKRISMLLLVTEGAVAVDDPGKNVLPIFKVKK